LRNLGKLTTVTCGLWAAGFLFVTSAAAQTLMPSTAPITTPLTDKDGNHIGTMTASDGRMYLRDDKGELIATIARDRDGKWTLYDPNGKVLDQLPR